MLVKWCEPAECHPCLETGAMSQIKFFASLWHHKLMDPGFLWSSLRTGCERWFFWGFGWCSWKYHEEPWGSYHESMPLCYCDVVKQGSCDFHVAGHGHESESSFCPQFFPQFSPSFRNHMSSGRIVMNLAVWIAVYSKLKPVNKPSSVWSIKNAKVKKNEVLPLKLL